MEVEFLHRDPLSVDWATILFVLTLAVIVVTRNTFPVRFAEFIRLGVSNKYLSVYRDANNMKSGFTISMFIVQMVSLSFFVHYVLSLFGHSQLDSLVSFVRVFSVLVFFVLIKYFIEKIYCCLFRYRRFCRAIQLGKSNLQILFRTDPFSGSRTVVLQSFSAKLFALGYFRNVCFNQRCIIYASFKKSSKFITSVYFVFYFVSLHL